MLNLKIYSKVLLKQFISKK